MAVGELIGGAIGILLLVIVAYVLVGATISTAEIVSSAQQDLTQNQLSRLHTDISVSFLGNATDGTVYFNITNTGNEPINDMKAIDVFIWPKNGNEPQMCKYSDSYGSNTWMKDKIMYIDPTTRQLLPEVIHPEELDPGEILYGYAFVSPEISPASIEVVTGNGISGWVHI